MKEALVTTTVSAVFQEQGRIDLKEKILDVAVRKFANDGFNTVSMRLLADEVGVTKPALYYHFRNKEELYEAARKHVTEHFMATIFRIPEDAVTLPGKVESFIANMFSYAATYPHRIMFFIRNVVFAFPNDTPGPGFGDVTRGCSHITIERSETLQQWFTAARQQGHLDDKINIEETVLSLIGVVNIRMHRLLVDPRYSLDKKQVHEIARRFLKAIDYKANRQDCGDTGT